MKNIILFFTLTLPFSTWAKIITKAEVKKRFIEAVSSRNSDFKDSYGAYKIDSESVEVSLPESIIALFTEVQNYNFDEYEIHADFYHRGQRYHYNVHVGVRYEGKEQDGYRYDLYTNGFYNSFYRVRDGKDAEIDGDIEYSWIAPKKYY